jgi:hypothetical protein
MKTQVNKPIRVHLAGKGGRPQEKDGEKKDVRSLFCNSSEEIEVRAQTTTAVMERILNFPLHPQHS